MKESVGIIGWWQRTWGGFRNQHPKAAKLIYQVFCFIVFSEGVTIFQYLVFTLLPYAFGRGMAEIDFMWPRIPMTLFGISFDWGIFGSAVKLENGVAVIGGGLGYFISWLIGTFLAQCINFPLQRNITFKSKGNPLYQAMWYFVAWVSITLLSQSMNNLWMPIAQVYLAPAIYNILVTFITCGISMVIFFFVFKIIFPEGEASQKKAN